MSKKGVHSGTRTDLYCSIYILLLELIVITIIYIWGRTELQFYIAVTTSSLCHPRAVTLGGDLV